MYCKKICKSVEICFTNIMNWLNTSMLKVHTTRSSGTIGKLNNVKVHTTRSPGTIEKLNNVKVHTTRSSGTIGKPNNVIVCGS